MATFGQGINPSLGAVNYAPYMQGAAMGAQALGQGIASFGQGIGQGIQQYKEVQKQNKEKEAVVKAGLKSLESLSQLPGIDKNVVTAISPLLQIANDPNASLVQKEAAIRNGIQQFNTVLGLGQQAAAQKQREQELKIAKDRMITERLAAMQDMFKGGEPITSIPIQAIKQYADAGIDVTGKLGPNGEIINPSFSGMPTQPKYVRSNEEELALMKQKAQIDAEGAALADSMKRDSAYLETIPVTAFESSDNLETNRQIRELLSKPETQTGAGQEYITLLRAGAARAGFEDAALADQQTLETYLKTDQLKQAQGLARGQGAVSNFERQLFADTSLTSSKSKESLIKILNLRDAVGLRALGAEQERQRLFDEGKTTREIAEGVRRWYSKNTITKFLEETRKAQEYDYSSALNIITGK